MAENKNRGNGGQHEGGNRGDQNRGDQSKGGSTSTIGQAMSNVGDTARNLAGQASQAAGSAASAVKDQAQHAGAAVAGGMSNLAGTIREHVPSQGMLGSVGATVADTLEGGGQYLQSHDLGAMADDVTALVRRNPIPAMLVCVGIGFCLGHLMSSSRS